MAAAATIETITMMKTSCSKPTLSVGWGVAHGTYSCTLPSVLTKFAGGLACPTK